MPDLTLDLKFELFLPLCSTPSTNVTSAFSSLIESCLDHFNTLNYEKNLLYNKNLINLNEVVSPVLLLKAQEN